MATVGGISCTFVKGALPSALRMRSERWQRAGINGEGLQLLGYAGVETTIKAVLYSNSAGVNAWATSMQALQGTVVTVVDDWSTTGTRMFLQEVGNCQKSTRLLGVITCRGEIEIKAVRV
jgi:hypothetical protein